MVGDPRDGRAIGGRGMRLGPRPPGLGAARGAVALVGPHVGRPRAGAVANAVSGTVGERGGVGRLKRRGSGLPDFVRKCWPGYIEGAVAGRLV